MEFIESEIVEFMEFIGFIRYDNRYIFRYKDIDNDINLSITLLIVNGYMNIYNSTTYLGSLTELSQIIDILNNDKDFPIEIIDSIRKYKLNQIINLI